MQKVIIASKNPVKINSVKIGFEKMFIQKEFEFQGIEANSGISDQPIGDNETYTGAKNRAENAKKMTQNADFWIGIEGGIEKKENSMQAFAWIVIISKKNIGKAKTATFFLPSKITALINQGLELGEADDIIFNQKNSKQKKGAVGILTHNIIDRTNYYSQAVILALIPFVNTNLY